MPGRCVELAVRWRTPLSSPIVEGGLKTPGWATPPSGNRLKTRSQRNADGLKGPQTMRRRWAVGCHRPPVFDISLMGVDGGRRVDFRVGMAYGTRRRLFGVGVRRTPGVHGAVRLDSGTGQADGGPSTSRRKARASHPGRLGTGSLETRALGVLARLVSVGDRRRVAWFRGSGPRALPRPFAGRLTAEKPDTRDWNLAAGVPCCGLVVCFRDGVANGWVALVRRGSRSFGSRCR